MNNLEVEKLYRRAALLAFAVQGLAHVHGDDTDRTLPVVELADEVAETLRLAVDDAVFLATHPAARRRLAVRS